MLTFYQKIARHLLTIYKPVGAGQGWLKVPIAISMDGRGSWRDNVCVEWLWRSVNYEDVYLRAYETVAEVRRLIGRYLHFFNTWRPRSSLGARTPDHVFFDELPTLAAAA